jgi:hypothetical protein
MQMKKSTSAPTKRKPVKSRFPKGWNQERVKAVIEYYDNQTDEEGAAEYEAAMELEGQSMMLVPTELVPEIRRLQLEKTP